MFLCFKIAQSPQNVLARIPSFNPNKWCCATTREYPHFSIAARPKTCPTGLAEHIHHYPFIELFFMIVCHFVGAWVESQA
jgi:hypothetical protein